VTGLVLIESSVVYVSIKSNELLVESDPFTLLGMKRVRVRVSFEKRVEMSFGYRIR